MSLIQFFLAKFSGLVWIILAIITSDDSLHPSIRSRSLQYKIEGSVEITDIESVEEAFELFLKYVCIKSFHHLNTDYQSKCQDS